MVIRVRLASLTAVVCLLAVPAARAQSSSSSSEAQTQEPPPTFKTEVIATTPLPGVGLPLVAIPAPVQTADSADITASGALDLSDFLNRRLTSVFINETQDNPFQPDVNYRGYTASPLLGTPQGLSVYMDGVRMNQPFGDVVAWDLIPRAAIRSTTLMPGSNPMFGLNTLGGALSVETKDGLTAAGTDVQVVGGGYGRRSVEFEHGGSSGAVNWYLTGNLFHDDGWRVASPSDVRQLFGKIGWKSPRTEVSLTAAYADNNLTGNGLQDVRLLATDYASVFTIPDTTQNRATFVNLTGRHSFTPDVTFTGNVYFRDIRANTSNGDENDDSLDESLYQLSAGDIKALTAAGYSGFPTTGANAANTPFPSWRCIAQALEQDEPDEKCNGLLTTTRTVQSNVGGSGQLTWVTPQAFVRHQVTLGGAFDASRVDFSQLSQFGYLNPDRSITPVNAFADGTTNVDGTPFDTRVTLHGVPQTWGAYAMDTVSFGDLWHATVSARFNRTTIDNTDLLVPAGGPGSLTATYHFDRVNPSAGLTFSPVPAVNLYVNYSEGSRAPTSIELGCADPTQPCKLPNAMAGDPPLNQVVTRSWEGGIRSGTNSALTWSAGVFRAANHDDIQFVSSTQTGFGYFKNFGETLRQGIELSASRRVRRVMVGGGYTFLDATYQSSETFDGSSNSTNDAALGGEKGVDGTIQVQPGDRMPLIPRHTFKLFADAPVTSRLSIDLDLVGTSGLIARGNENNLDQPDGVYYIGHGSTPGYAVVNLGARYQLSRRLRLIAQVNNLFDQHYYTAAQLGSTGLTSSGTFVGRPFPAVNGDFPVQNAAFYAPGAPTTFWIGLRVGL